MRLLPIWLLGSSLWAVAEPAPDLTRAGLAGLLCYVVISLARIWVDSPAARRHHDDCRERLIDIQATLRRVLQMAEHDQLPRHGRQHDPPA